MQFQVPQFIETEDKIVGPLSLRQFMYIVIGTGIVVILYFLLQTWLWALLSLPAMGLAVAFAFVKVNGRPFVQLVKSALFFYWKPQRYVWQSADPSLPKNQETMSSLFGGLSLEHIVSGLALKSAWQNVQVGNKASAEKANRTMTKLKERYEILEKVSGERRMVKRVDYR